MSAFQWFLIFSLPSWLLVAAGVDIWAVAAGVAVIGALVAAMIAITTPTPQPVAIFINVGGLHHA